MGDGADGAATGRLGDAGGDPRGGAGCRSRSGGYDVIEGPGGRGRGGGGSRAVNHYHGGKAELFAAAMRLPVSPAELIAALLDEGVDGFGPRLIGRVLEIWEGWRPAIAWLLGLLRSAATNEAAAVMLREFLAGGRRSARRSP